jgi:hypothetical protein
MRRQQPDRVPIFVRGVAAHDPAWAASRGPSYAPLIAAVREHGDLRTGIGIGGGIFLTGADVPVSTQRQAAGEWVQIIATYHTPRGALVSKRWDSLEGHPGMTSEFAVKTERDVERALSVPYEPPPPDFAGYLAQVATIGERGIVLISFPNPISFAHDLLGSSLLAEWSITNRELVERLVRVAAERLEDTVRRWLADPRVTAPVFAASGHEYAGPPLLSPRDFHELCTEVEKPLVRMIHDRGGLLHIHCHGPMNAIIEEFVELGADCLHPVEAPPMGDLPLAEAKCRVGRDLCLEGNIQIGDVLAMETARFTTMVEQAMRDGRPGGAFILCPTASPYTPVLSDRARDNYLAMIETGVRLGAYTRA